MEYVIVDDEERARNLLKILLVKSDLVNANDTIILFDSAENALLYLKSHSADIIFLDIEMPVMDGITLAEHIKNEIADLPAIIFVTAFPEYALKAWEVNACGYIVKPYEPEQIKSALDKALFYRRASVRQNDLRQPSKEKEKLRVCCFPDFDVYYKGSPLQFPSKKAKELFALLIHYKGNWVSIDKITFALLENCEEYSSKNYSRTILYRLKKTLRTIGYEGIIESAYGKVRVNIDAIYCDYYEYLSGKSELFQGEYMSEYSWAEPTQAVMWSNAQNPSHL